MKTARARFLIIRGRPSFELLDGDEVGYVFHADAKHAEQCTPGESYVVRYLPADQFAYLDKPAAKPQSIDELFPTPKDRKLAIAEAVEALHAVPDPYEAGRWAYFADETRSWWSVTEESLLRFVETRIRLAVDLPSEEVAIETYNEWAENDGDAVELGRELPRKG